MKNFKVIPVRLAYPMPQNNTHSLQATIMYRVVVTALFGILLFAASQGDAVDTEMARQLLATFSGFFNL